MKQGLKIIIWLLIVVICVTVLVFLFIKIFIVKESLYFSSAIGAFMGAFFAYIVSSIGGYISGILQRRKKGYIALFKIEKLINFYLTINHDNQFLLNSWKDAINRKRFFIVILDKLEIDRGIEDEINYVELLNEFFSLNVNLQKFNSAIPAISSLYDKIIFEFKNDGDEDKYKSSLKYFLKKIDELSKFCTLLDDKFIDILSKVRILQKDNDPIWTFFIIKKYSDKQNAQFDIEKEKILKEIEQISQESKKELNFYDIKKESGL